ncbi:replicative helicase loader/inhibitor [Peribacillus loiseleuriae]|uniref:Uncharacterized protein n=1 Tax=Peribacillus loiseleuriae TaxID=1679170 RepID=A0A0K9GTF1_9BACI|nr:replicative helicase loader/inhibitor [Peribacillus loiseleuriae]KMY49542.1 hypothetical protein AC625_08285 [Peribacillus loiseleuriae]
MDRKQIAILLNTIQASYPGKFQVEDPVGLLNSWERVLRKHDCENVMKNFERHLETNVFAPTLADLVKVRPLDRLGGIPNANETLEYLSLLDRPEELTESQLVSIEQSKAEIRRILGRA